MSDRARVVWGSFRVGWVGPGWVGWFQGGLGGWVGTPRRVGGQDKSTTVLQEDCDVNGNGEKRPDAKLQVLQTFSSCSNAMDATISTEVWGGCTENQAGAPDWLPSLELPLRGRGVPW